MKKSNWVMIVPVISTAHLPSRDLEYFETESLALISDSGETSIIYIGPADNVYEYAGDFPSIVKVAEWAHSAHPECEWVRLDCDADTIEGLPQFEDGDECEECSAGLPNSGGVVSEFHRDWCSCYSKNSV